MKKKLTMVLLASLTIGSLLLPTTTSFAWTAGEDSQTGENEIKANENGVIPVEGWIGTFDPTDPTDPNTEPNERPTPEDPTDPSWINVTIPTKVLFGSLASEKPAITSPKYTVTNNSVKKVTVAASKITSVSNPIELLTLNLKHEATEHPIIKPNAGSTVYLGEAGLPAFDIATLKGVNEMAGTNDFFNFTISGEVPAAHDYSVVAKPKYELTLKFSSHD